MAFEPGTILGDYEVLGPIGAGGMGTVYKVRNTLSDRIEALKILLPDLQTAGHLEERFLREIRVLASLAHPNIASLHTAVRLNNQLLMLMEYVEGRSLSSIMRATRVPTNVAADYARQTLAAVAFAHGRGVVHRDIKPSNVMVSTQGTVKLLDFGIATMAASKKLTRTGVVIGSLHYMSPEQVQAGPADARSDVYSLGVTFYELFTGRCPIEGESDYAVMTAHLFNTPQPPSQVDPAVPAAISDLIGKAMEKEPAKRFQSAAEFLSAFQGVVRRTPAGAQAAETGPATLTMKLPANIPTGPAAPPPPATPVPATPPPASKPGTGSGQSAPVDTAAIEAITKELAVFIGPIARLVVRKAAGANQTVGELAEAVSTEIPDPQDRSRFLTAVRRIRASTRPV